MTQNVESVSMENYSRALDEIYHLRSILAHEADVLRAHLDYKTFPKSRRQVALEQVERMVLAALGDADRVYMDMPSRKWKAALRDAGAKETLTRWQWEAER